MTETNILLSFPTNKTIDGPRLHQISNRLVVEYDCELDNGSVEWSNLIFNDVLVVEYRQDSCCTGKSVVGANMVRCLAESTWLSGILSVWQESVGWQNWQKEQGGRARFKHFTVFFDNAGCVDVVAASCSIG